MLFISTDMKKFQSMSVYHILYKNRNDPECPFLNIRISSFRPDFTHNYVKIQVLSFVYSANESQRLIAVSKIQVLAEEDLKIPKSTLNPHSFNQLPLNLAHLIIKRKSLQSMKEFQICYLNCDFSDNNVENHEFLRVGRLIKNIGLRRKSSKKLLKNTQVNASILSAIK